MERDTGSVGGDGRCEFTLTARAVLDALTAHIAIVDADGRILLVNERWREFARRGRASLAAVCEGANYLAACDASARTSPEAAAVAAGIRAVLAGDVAEFAREYPCATPAEERWFAVRVTAVCGDVPRCVVVAHEDITARVAAARMSREREKLLLACVQQAPASIAMFDRKMNYLAASQRWTSEFGRGRADLTGLNHYAVFADLPAHWPAIHQRGLAGERISATNERWTLADGTDRWASWTVTPWTDAAGLIGGILILTEDTTAQKRMELELRASEERFSRIIQALPIALFTCDAHGRIGLFNAAAERVWGRKPDPDRDRWSCAHRVLTPAGTPIPCEQWPIAVVARSGKPIRGAELILERRDGSRSHVLSFPEPILDAAGVISGVVNMHVDVTELKAAEAALRENEQRLRLALAAGQFGTFEVNLHSGATVWNEEQFRLLGYAVGEVVPCRDRWAERVHPDDLAATEAVFTEAKLQGVDFTAHCRSRWPDGTIRHLEAHGKFERDAEGQAVTCHGVVRNITRRWEAEAALVDAKRRMEGVVESAMDAIISVDEGHRIVLFNGAAERMFRCSAGEAIGGLLERFIPARFRAAHAGHQRRYAESGVTARAMGRPGAIHGLRADGTEFPLEASISTSEVGGEKIATVILRDVTERKRLEQEVLEIGTHERRRIGQELHDDICQWLVGVELLSTALAANLAEAAPASAASAHQIAEGVRLALLRMRALARGLAATIPATLGLAGVLRELAKTTTEVFGTRCVFDGPEQFAVRNESAALHLYRIAQEAVGNATRHSGATEIRVELRSEEQGSRLSIRDNGRGLPRVPADPLGMGKNTMRYRAGMIGGALEIRSGDAGGTEVTCTFPRDL